MLPVNEAGTRARIARGDDLASLYRVQ